MIGVEYDRMSIREDCRLLCSHKRWFTSQLLFATLLCEEVIRKPLLARHLLYGCLPHAATAPPRFQNKLFYCFVLQCSRVYHGHITSLCIQPQHAPLALASSADATARALSSLHRIDLMVDTVVRRDACTAMASPDGVATFTR